MGVQVEVARRSKWAGDAAGRLARLVRLACARHRVIAVLGLVLIAVPALGLLASLTAGSASFPHLASSQLAIPFHTVVTVTEHLAADASRPANDTRAKGLVTSPISPKDAPKKASDEYSGEVLGDDLTEVDSGAHGLFELFYLNGFPNSRPICRVHHACIHRNGSFLLPSWMSKYKPLLDGCIHDPLFLPGRKLRAAPHSNKVDMLGFTPPRTLRPFFVVDILQSLISMDVVANSALRKQATRKCFSHNYDLCKDVKAETVYPTLPLTKGILDLPKTDWVRQLLYNLHSKSSMKYLDIASVHTGLVWNSDIWCPRSVISSTVIPYSMPPGIFKSSLGFFKSQHISREPVSAAHAKTTEECTIEVTIGNGLKSIQSVPELRAALTALAAQKELKHLKLRIGVTSAKDTSSLDRMKSIMQKTDVYIGAHEEDNVNWLFLRPGALVLEIFHFGIHAGPYNSLAQLFELEYSEVNADPDTTTFFDCLDKRLDAEHRNSDLVRSLKKRWTSAANEFNERGTYRSLHLERSDGTVVSTAASICVRSQKLTFAVGEIADYVMSQSSLICLARRS